MATRPLRTRLALLLFGIFFTLLLVEIGVRLLKLPITGYYRSTCVVEADEELGFKFRPNSVAHLEQFHEIDNMIYINSLGFHDVEHPLEPPGDAVRILVVGDSYTAAGQVPIDQGWTQTMERNLTTPAEVINLGVDGTGTDYHLATLQKYVPLLQPNVVILAFYENDLDDILVGTRLDCYRDHLLVFQSESQRQRLMEYLDNNKPGPLAYTLADYSYLFRAVYPLLTDNGFLVRSNVINPNHAGVPAEPDREFPPDYFANLFRQMSDLAQEYDFQLLLVPAPSKTNPGRSLAVLKETVPPDVSAVIPVIDVYPQMEAQLAQRSQEHQELFFNYDAHLNREGYQLFGEVVAQAVEPYLSR